jgi:hypothetical protein
MEHCLSLVECYKAGDLSVTIGGVKISFIHPQNPSEESDLMHASGTRLFTNVELAL